MDAHHQPNGEKFSFIYTLSFSSLSERDCQDRSQIHSLNLDAVAIQQELAAQSVSEAWERPNSNLASALAAPDDTAATISAQWFSTESLASSYNLDLSATTPTSEAATIEPPCYKNNYLGKIFWFGACSYLILVMSWLFGYQSEYLWAIVRGKQPVVLSKSEAEFIDYMERSLAAIDDSQQSVAAPETTDTDSQVVYVPVFTPRSTPSPTALPQASITHNQANNIPQPLAEPPEKLVKIPSPPPLPAPTPATESPSAKPPTPSQPAVKHTLIGVLELGERSAALFKIKGATKQIWQGQGIGNSGWTVDSVTNQEVQISNGEQVRSLSVGEKF